MPHSIPRRRFIAGMAAFGLWGLAPRLPAAESGASKSSAKPLADRLAAYADRLRYDDLRAATLERAKSHFIDTIGCAIAAFDETPVRRTGAPPAGRGARRRHAAGALSRAACAGRQSRPRRPRPERAKPGRGAVRLEGPRRGRGRAQRGVCGTARARPPDRPGADLR